MRKGSVVIGEPGPELVETFREGAERNLATHSFAMGVCIRCALSKEEAALQRCEPRGMFARGVPPGVEPEDEVQPEEDAPLAALAVPPPPRPVPVNVERIETIDISLIDPSPYNTPGRAQEGVEELAASIRAKGLLSEPLVRPMGERYQIVFGERRWGAAQLAGVTEIRVKIRELSDEDAMELTVIENLQRRNLHPIQEAKQISLLLARPGWTHHMVAEQIGVRDVGVVSKRAHLVNLSAKWMAAAQNPDHPAYHWGVTRLELIARIDPKIQEKVFPDAWSSWWRMTAHDLEQTLSEYTQELKRAPWKVDDAELYKKIGACTTCPKRSSHVPGLFDVPEDEPQGNSKIPPGDRCLDKSCWDKKKALYVDQRKAELREEHGEALVLLKGGYTMGGKKEEPGTYPEYVVTACKKTDEGAKPAVYLNSTSRGGQFGWVKIDKQRASSAAASSPTPKARTLKELRADLVVKRKMLALKLLAEAVKLIELPPGGVPQVLGFALVFGLQGTSSRQLSHWNADCSKQSAQAWTGIGSFDGENVNVETILRESVWPAMRQIIVERVTCTQDYYLPAHWTEAKKVTEFFGLERRTFESQAAKDLPEPKAWAKLNPDGSPKTAVATVEGKKPVRKVSSKKVVKPAGRRERKAKAPAAATA